jgi:D-alanyl-D-alanine carboxypeptidase (penicillin-binding protein 5/6)
MKFSCRTIITWLLAITFMTTPALGQATTSFETLARNAILIEMDTGTVLYEKGADERLPPASMSKLMTIYLTFEQLAKGAISMEDTFPVSVPVWQRWYKSEGSLMFVREGERVSVHDLLMGIIVQSGNDACDVIAEGLAGSTEVFADWMNKKAKELGLTNSHFVNAHGWPDPDHYMSLRDIAILSERIIRDFPQYYPMFAEKSFTYANIPQGNRNPLLYSMPGADGLKTGHTEEAGYGVSVSAVQDGRRLIAVIAGTNNMRERGQEAERILTYGFRNFKTYELFKPGQTIEEAAVWLGAAPTVPLIAPQGVKVTLHRSARNDLKVTLSYEAPLPAPVEAGQPVGVAKVQAPGMADLEIPVVAGQSVGELTGFARIKAAFSHLLWGNSEAGAGGE